MVMPPNLDRANVRRDAISAPILATVDAPGYRVKGPPSQSALPSIHLQNSPADRLAYCPFPAGQGVRWIHARASLMRA